MTATNAASGSRFQIALTDGTVIGCNTAEDVTQMIVAIRRSEDALSVDQPQPRSSRRRSSGREEASSAAARFAEAGNATGVRTGGGPPVRNTSPAESWTSELVMQMLAGTTEHSAALLRAGVQLGQGAKLKEAASRVADAAGGTGPMVRHIRDQARITAPHLPAPFETTGINGQKSMKFDPSFFAAAKEAFKT